MIIGDSKTGKKQLFQQMANSQMFSLWETNGAYKIFQKEADFNPEGLSDESVLYIFVLLYDLSRLDTLDYAHEMFRKINTEMRSDFMVYLAGNKSDLIEEYNAFDVREKVYGKIEE
jgi:hypothetical protein